jgi:starch-binding outer membrane protein, SusD/RagB family
MIILPENRNRIVYWLMACICVVIFTACTKLRENFRGDLAQGQVAADTASATVLLPGVYNSMEGPFTAPFDFFPLDDLTTDEAILPTRGTDWDDNGVWRAFHEQKWDADNIHIAGTFNDLGGIVFAATDLLRYHPTVSQAAQARLIRAWAMYWMLDMYNQVPYRDPGESVVLPARVLKDTAALGYIIAEILAVQNDLPDGPAYVANKYAAMAILMKCYLNKAVYLNRANPVFEVTDMNEVIRLADLIINSKKFSLTKNYFDNFAPDNTNNGTENIFTLLNIAGGTNNNNVFFSWLLVLDYAQGGINGAATLPGFYNKFEAFDKRRQAVYSTPASPPNPNNLVNLGFMVGRQYDLPSGMPLNAGANQGLPLIYTAPVLNIETGSNYEVTGIRPFKYYQDYNNLFSPDNDFVFLRLADVLLMKAEAILRNGTPTNTGGYGGDATSIVNAIRTDSSRGASHLSSVSVSDLLDERGRELWWEGWRRQDMIRFGTFLKPFDNKDYQSDPHYLIFPIPNSQLAVNHYLTQNPGY